MINYLKELYNNEIVFICIGSDKCIGDSLGPIVGELLEKRKLRIPIYGTLNEPIHALNIEEKIKILKIIHPNSLFVVIDASLGNEKDVGYIHIIKGPIRPGIGSGKNLPIFGDISILGVVDSIDNKTKDSLYTVRLNFIMRMAEVIADGIVESLKLNKKVI